MADTHYAFDRSKTAGYRLALAHEALDGLRHLKNERDTMVQMRNGDGSLDSHYDAVTTAYGFANSADAKNAFLELDSLVAKIDTDASVSSVKAAINQFLARLRS